MKTFFKVSVLGLLMVVLTAVTFTTAMAQGGDEQAAKTALYNKFLQHYDKNTIEDKQIAIDTAKEYNSKYNKPEDKQLNDYFNAAIPDLEKWIAKEKIRLEEKAKAEARRRRLSRLNTAYNAINANPNDAAKWDEYFAAGDDVLRYEPKYVDVSIVLASGGSEMPKELLSESKYQALTLKYANQVINQLESGVTSKKHGEFRWVYGSKDKALTWMTIIIGDIKGMNSKDSAIPYYYKALQYNEGKKNWNLYRLIGNWYRGKAVATGKIRVDLDLEVEENIEKAKELLGIEKAYVDRAIDAYARSYSLARSDKDAKPAQKTALYDSLKELFAFRYDKEEEKEMKSDANINSYVARVNSSPMPNPASEVTPVKLEDDPPADKTTEDATKKVDAKTSGMKAGATRSRTVSKTTKDN